MDTFARIHAESLSLVLVEILGWRATHGLQLGSPERRNPCQAQMRESIQALQNAKDSRYRDVLAVTQMDALQRIVSIYQTVDRLVGEVDDFDQADSAELGHVVGNFGDRKIGEVGTTGDVDVAKASAGTREMCNGAISDVGNVAEVEVV